jgi:hypothetical protein
MSSRPKDLRQLMSFHLRNGFAFAAHLRKPVGANLRGQEKGAGVGVDKAWQMLREPLPGIAGLTSLTTVSA